MSVIWSQALWIKPGMVFMFNKWQNFTNSDLCDRSYKMADGRTPSRIVTSNVIHQRNYDEDTTFTCHQNVHLPKAV